MNTKLIRKQIEYIEKQASDLFESQKAMLELVFLLLQAINTSKVKALDHDDQEVISSQVKKIAYFSSQIIQKITPKSPKSIPGSPSIEPVFGKNTPSQNQNALQDRKSLEALQEKNQDLIEKSNTLTREIHEAERTWNQQNKRYSELKREYDKWTRGIQSIEKNIQDIEQNIQTTQEVYRELQVKIQHLKQEYVEVEQKFSIAKEGYELHLRENKIALNAQGQLSFHVKIGEGRSVIKNIQNLLKILDQIVKSIIQDRDQLQQSIQQSIFKAPSKS